MSRPLVSVIVPCYKQAHFLPNAIDSVLNQTYTPVEIIVVNDGSPDNVEEVMQAYLAKPGVHLINRENGGLAAARNSGLSVANGKYLQFLDSDDWLHPEKIERQVAILEESAPEVGLVYCEFWPVYNNTEIREDDSVRQRCLGKTIEQDYFNNIWIQGYFPPMTVLLKKEWQQKVGLFTETLRSHEDYEYWLRLSGLGGLGIYHSEKLAYYRQHSASLSRDEKKMQETAIAARSNVAAMFPERIGPATDYTIRRLLEMSDEIRAWAGKLQDDVFRIEDGLRQALVSLEQKNQHIEHLENHIARLENGRFMRISRWTKQRMYRLNQLRTSSGK
ncbi:MAG TPA: glycosyltransferase family A protein [Chloroflexia bacterium]|nr:glycosyltransferase family A protein [Chloroflexia bacterium]